MEYSTLGAHCGITSQKNACCPELHRGRRFMSVHPELRSLIVRNTGGAGGADGKNTGGAGGTK